MSEEEVLEKWNESMNNKGRKSFICKSCGRELMDGWIVGNVKNVEDEKPAENSEKSAEK